MVSADLPYGNVAFDFNDKLHVAKVVTPDFSKPGVDDFGVALIHCFTCVGIATPPGIQILV